MMQIRQKHPWLWRVLLMAALFWLVCNGLVLHRFYSFYSSYANYNQGIFDQLFWNSLHGRWFESSLSSALSSAVVLDGELPTVWYQRLGQHFTPSLLLWLPFYALYQSPAGLSVLQTTLVAAAGLVLYALARHYHPPQVSGLIAASFFAASAVISPTLADFRDFSQLLLFVFGALWAFEKRRWWLYGVLVVLTLLIREDAGIVLFGFGLFFIVSRRNVAVGLATCLVSFVYVLLVTNVVMPMLSDDISKRFMIEQFGQFVESDQATTLEVVLAIARNPLLLAKELITPVDRTVEYLLAQWLPLAFVPAIAPQAWVVAGIPTLLVLIRKAPDALSISLRYALTLVPGLFYGAILWWAAHRDRFQPNIKRFWLGCIGLSLVLALLSNPNRVLSFAIPDSFQPWVYVSPARQWQHAQAIRSLLAQIPPDDSAAATVHIAGHLSNRRELLLFPDLRLRNDDNQPRWVKYAIADLWAFEQYENAFDDDRDRLKKALNRVDQVLEQNRYGLIDIKDGVLLLQRRTPSNPAALSDWQTYRNNLPESITAQSAPDMGKG